MCPFDYDARNKYKKWEAKGRIHEKRVLLKVERPSSLAWNVVLIKVDLGVNDLKNSPLRKLP